MTCDNCILIYDNPDDLRRCKDCEIKKLKARVRELKDQVMWMRPRIDELLEEQRWRKWPEEKPECDSRIPHQVIHKGYSAQAVFTLSRWFLDELRSDDDITDEMTHWRPIGELPEGRQNVDRRAGNEIPN